MGGTRKSLKAERLVKVFLPISSLSSLLWFCLWLCMTQPRPGDPSSVVFPGPQFHCSFSSSPCLRVVMTSHHHCSPGASPSLCVPLARPSPPCVQSSLSLLGWISCCDRADATNFYSSVWLTALLKLHNFSTEITKLSAFLLIWHLLEVLEGL